jgi:zinc protease
MPAQSTIGLPKLSIQEYERRNGPDVILHRDTAATGHIRLPAGVERVTSVEGITEYRLQNGLHILLFPDQTKQTITVNITYLVGSKHENYGETGMAHLLEHLLFKGTPRHPNIPQELTEHGTRSNGATTADGTTYYETFSATNENLNWALDLEADRMVNSFIAKKDLDSEFTVVRNEFEAGENSPHNVLQSRVMATAYLWHNYGKATIGARSDIENVPIDRLQAFYKTYYQPDNAVLLVAGKIDEQKNLDLVHKYFGSIPKPTRTLPKIYTEEPDQDGDREVTLRRLGDTKLVMATYHIPPGSHPDFAAVRVLISILGDRPSGRLYKSLIETKKASLVFAFPHRSKEPGLGFFAAELRKEDSIDAARNALLETVETFVSNPPTSEEIERAKVQYLKYFELRLKDSDLVGLALTGSIALGDWRLFFLERDRIKKVTSEDVMRVATAYLKPSNRTVGMFIPTEKPDRAAIPSVKDEELAVMLKDYKADTAVAIGEAFDPSPANIESRTKYSTIDGLKVAMLTKENRGDSVVANLTLNFGDEKSLMNRSTTARFVGEMLLRGTARRTREQIKDEIDRLKAQVGIFGFPNAAGVRIESTRQNLPEVLRLIGEMLREPTFPANEFDSLKKQQLTVLESQKNEPTRVAGDVLGQHFNIHPKGHPLNALTLDEQIAAIQATTLNEVKRFYKDFYGASSGQLIIVGDFDEAPTIAVVREIFDGWKSFRPFERIKNEYRDISPLNKSLETPDKTNASFFAALKVKMRDDNPDYPALVLGNYMFGGGFLNSRLAVRLRQKDGVSYTVFATFGANALDEVGQFFAQVIYAPENVQKVEKGFKEELARMLKDGFTAEEVAAAKTGWLQSRQVSRAQDRELAGQLNNYLFFDRTIAWDADFEAKIKALTPEQINTAMRKHISPDKIAIVKAGDFASGKEKAKAATPNQ